MQTFADAKAVRVACAEAQWQAVNYLAPTDAMWGMFSYGDGPAAAGGGVGIHTWFATRAEMLEFIVNVLPYDPPGREDVFVVASVVTSIVDNMQRGVFDDATGMAYLNTALNTFSQITWMGTFAELCTSTDTHPCMVRDWCRKEWLDDGEIARQGPIHADELDDFLSMLPGYGT